jgi:hypothetical protein
MNIHAGLGTALKEGHPKLLSQPLALLDGNHLLFHVDLISYEYDLTVWLDLLAEIHNPASYLNQDLLTEPKLLRQSTPYTTMTPWLPL